MLRKLLKYDLKWIYKVIVVFYLLSFFFSILGRVFTSIENSTIFQIIGQVSYAIAITMMVNSIINNLMRAWARFVRNTYKDESYLTHTLPVKKSVTYLSKVLAAIITIFTTVFVTILCIAVCYYSEANMQALKVALEMMASAYDSTVIGLLLTVCTVVFLQLLFAVLCGYLGIIIGHKSNNYKILKSVLYGIGLYMLAQAVTLLCIYLIGFVNPNIMNLFTTAGGTDINTIKTILYIGILIYVIYNAIYYEIGRRKLTKGVNID